VRPGFSAEGILSVRFVSIAEKAHGEVAVGWRMSWEQPPRHVRMVHMTVHVPQRAVIVGFELKDKVRRRLRSVRELPLPLSLH
jgi:hypothetical protein